MIDTVKLRSPALTDEQAALVEQHLKLRLGVDLKTGEKLYEVTADALEGSWDNRIMVQLLRQEMAPADAVRASVRADTAPVADPRSLLHPNPVVQAERRRVAALREARKAVAAHHRPVFMMRDCAPYLVVEGSVHKAMVGHNITGGPTSFQAAACWFVNFIATELLWTCLPHGSLWQVEKVDITECYRLPYEAIEEFIGSLNRVEYPRRERASFGCHSLSFGGTTTAFKLYHKGPEFAKHDAKKLRDLVSAEALAGLQDLANGIMRCEVSVKGKKLKADAESGLLETVGGKPLVGEVTDAYLQAVHDHEVARVIREGRGDVKTIRTAREVRQRLFEQYGPGLGGSLFGLWVGLSTDGETEVRKTMSRRTFYRQRKQLLDAGCSWAGTDIIIRHTSIPVGFTLMRSDPRCDDLEDARVSNLLASYRQAA